MIQLTDADAFQVDPEMLRALELPPALRAAEGSLLDRLRWMREAGITFDGRRDLYHVLGYKRQLSVADYVTRYQRGGIAGRIVDVMPDATWRGDPAFEVIEDKDPKVSTPFEQAFTALALRLQLTAKFHRVDKLSRLSTFAVLLIGAEGTLDSELPKGGRDEQKLLYLTPFLGGGSPGGTPRSRLEATTAPASVYEYETDSANIRFGLPRSYWLKRQDLPIPAFMTPVHWSRIIHIAEDLLEDDVYGMPTLERVWNLLDDLEKVTGGGAEAFWLRANQGMHLDVDKDLALNADTQKMLDALKKQSEDYKHQLTRWIQSRGVKATPLGSDVANFSNPADAILTQIAGSKAIPKRILTGSEMGELASSQDRENFRDQVNGRQTMHAAPYIVRQFVDRMLEFEYLPPPADGVTYEVTWPHIQTLTEQERAEGATQWTTANKTQGVTVFTDDEIRNKWYGYEPLTPEQKVPIAAPVKESATAGDNPDAVVKPDKAPLAPADKPPKPTLVPAPKKPALVAAEASDDELVQVLAAALEVGQMDVVNEILAQSMKA